MRSMGGVRISISIPLLPSCSSRTSISCMETSSAPFLVGIQCLETKLHSKFQSESRWGGGVKSRLSSGGRVRASNNDKDIDLPSSNLTTTTQDSEKEVLAAKLAAAEAEAKALKKELALRRAGSSDGDLSKLKIATPEKRIDGTGYREQLFSGPGAKKEKKKWGITEGELFLSKGAPTEGRGLGVPAMDEGAEETVSRRLVFGLGITGAVLALAFIKLPVLLTKPSKPLFFYLTYILQLKEMLDTLEATASDAKYAETQLKRALRSEQELKDNFLSAASLFDGTNPDRASQLAFEIFGFLNQADSSKYFESFGEPTSSQKVENLKFSLQSMKAAAVKIQEFLNLAPAEALRAAKLQVAS